MHALSDGSVLVHYGSHISSVPKRWSQWLVEHKSLDIFQASWISSALWEEGWDVILGGTLGFSMHCREGETLVYCRAKECTAYLVHISKRGDFQYNMGSGLTSAV